MNIEIKKSKNPVNYQDAIKDLEHRLSLVFQNKEKELIWTLEHNEIYTGGTSYKENEILNNSINFVKTNRGGKITYHGPGQLICYFVIDLRNRKKDIRNFEYIFHIIRQVGIKRNIFELISAIEGYIKPYCGIACGKTSSFFFF